MKTKKLINLYELFCNYLIKNFSKKQDIEFDGWVGDDIGGVAVFISQYHFNINDIVFDLKTKQPKGLILKWQNDHVDFNIDKKPKEHKSINYKSYTMGLRLKDL